MRGSQSLHLHVSKTLEQLQKASGVPLREPAKTIAQEEAELDRLQAQYRTLPPASLSPSALRTIGMKEEAGSNEKMGLL